MTTPRLGAPELTSGQATPETTVNEQIRYIESGAGHFIFKDRDLATPPGSPADGDCYLVAASPTGAWAGQAGKIAFRVNTAWVFITAIEGFTAWINDENVFVGYDGAAWNTLSAPSGSYQPLDSDLTAIAALATTSFGRSLLTQADAAATRTTVGATTVGGNIFTLTNPSAITFVRINADNTVDALSASAFRTAIGAGTGSGTGDLLSTNNLSDVANPATALANLGGAPLSLTVTSQSGTSYTAVLADAGTHLRFTSASAVTFTVPPNSSVAYPIGTRIRGTQAGRDRSPWPPARA
jgi:hypothetical protein